MLALAAEPGAVEQVDQLAEPALVDVVPVVEPRQGAAEALVRGHDRVHRPVDQRADRARRIAAVRGLALGVLGQV